MRTGRSGGELPALLFQGRNLRVVSLQLVEKPLFRRIRLSVGGGARGGGSPPRVGSNALNALQGKAFSERSEDFPAAQRRESNGIFAGCQKSPWTFSTAWREKPAGFSLQLVEKPLFRRIRLSVGGGARGGGSPPRVGSNALNALQGKAFSERSEDFPAAQRRESNGIFAGCRKSPWTFSTA